MGELSAFSRCFQMQVDLMELVLMDRKLEKEKQEIGDDVY